MVDKYDSPEDSIKENTGDKSPYEVLKSIK